MQSCSSLEITRKHGRATLTGLMAEPPPKPRQDPYAALPVVTFLLCQSLGWGNVPRSLSAFPVYIFWIGAGAVAMFLLMALMRFTRGRPLHVHLLPTFAVSVAFILLAHPVLGAPWFRIFNAVVLWSVFAAGSTLLAYGIHGRVEPHPRCANCGYERGEAPDIPDQCPECGRVWTARGGIVSDRVVRTPWMIWMGVGLFLLAMFSMFWPLMGGSFLSRALPTRILLAQAASSQYISPAQWAEIAARNAPPTDVAVALLDYQSRGGFLPTQATAWLETQVTTRTIPPAIIQRFYAEWQPLKLLLPDSAKVNEPLRIEVGSDRPNYSPTMMAFAAVSDAWVNDQPFSVDRPAQFIPPGARGRTGATNSITVTPSQPGPLHIRIRVWEVLGPSALINQAPQWDAEGALISPAGAAWLKSFDFTCTFDVKP